MNTDPSPSKSRRIIGSIVTAVFICGLVGLVATAWFPQPCSKLKGWLGMCHTLIIPQTPDQIELARIPHQELTTGVGIFGIHAQDKRAKTVVDFDFKTDYQTQTAVLELFENGAYQSVGLITQPLLVNLNWSKITSTDPSVTLYQQGNPYTDLTSFQANLPAASTLAADAGAAAQLGLTSSQYTPLEPLTSLTGISYILTTYEQPAVDGTWRLYDHRFNLQAVTPTKTGDLAWRVSVLNFNASAPFYLGEMHIDYQDDRL